MLHPAGDKPPCLQEHSAVVHKECIYVFGGELGFSAGNETPLWVYHVKVRFKEMLHHPLPNFIARDLFNYLDQIV